MKKERTKEASRWFQKGVHAQDNSQIEEAINAYNTTLQITPDHFEATYNLAVLYHKLDQLQTARKLYLTALKLNPSSALTYKGLGDVLFSLQETAQSLFSFYQALKIKPEFPEVWHNIGVVEKHLQHLPKAMTAYQQAVKLRPNYLSALTSIAELAQQTNSINETVSFLLELIQNNPLNTRLKITLAEIFHREHQQEKALTFILESLQIDKNNSEAFNLLGLIHLQRGETNKARHFLTQARELSPDSKRINSNLLYSLITDPETSTTEYLQEASLWWQKHGAPLAARTIYNHKRSLNSKRVLRLAFISGDFCRHSISYFFLPLISNLSATKFEIYCYSDTYNTDNFTTQIRNHSDHWHSIYGLDDHTVANMIAKDKIDVLIELSGHTANNRLTVIAHQAAPVQFSWLGYPASTGISNNTYRLTDKITDPPANQSHYTEKIVYLSPLFLCYAPPPEVKTLPICKTHHPSQQIVFASFNNSAKINQKVIHTWAKIMQLLPQAIIIFKTRTLKDKAISIFIKKSFAGAGINSERIVIYGDDFSIIDHFNAYNNIDLALDPFPYNGTTTTCDALWMGVPVITLRGENHAARVGTTLLQALGCPELIASDESDYIKKTVSLATNPELLSKYHNKIRKLMQNSPIMNFADFAIEFSQAIENRWHQWRCERLKMLQDLASNSKEVLNLPHNLAALSSENDTILSFLEKSIDKHQHPFLKLGQSYLDKQLPRAAYLCFREALSTDSNNFAARYALALTLDNLGKKDEAACNYRIILQTNPKFSRAAVNLSSILTYQNREDEALQILLAANSQTPNNSSINFQLANTYYHMRRPSEAYKALCLCLKLKPKQAGIWNNLGYLMAESGKMEKATECFRHALTINPNLKESQTNLIWHLAQACDWTELNKIFKDCKHFAPLLSIILQADPRQNLHHSHNAVQKSTKESKTMPLLINSARVQKTIIKIGYLSCDFRDHPVAHNMLNLFRFHNRDSFHVTAYSCGLDDSSSYRQFIRNNCDNFVDLQKLSDQESAKKINADGIQILIELMGHTRENRLEICAFKPAPVQISYLGYPGTTGASFIDYLIADKIVIPEDEKKYYTENIIYLPDCFMVADRAPIGHRPSRSECNLPENGFIFCSFNSPFKIEPVMFKTWMKILKAVPRSFLWLRGGSDRYEENLRQEALRQGIDQKNLIFAARVQNKQDHLARLQLADLALDTRIYNGHTTTLDALWAGVPVITSQGSHFASRVSESNLKAIRLPKMVTQNLELYKRTAINLALNPKKLKSIRDQLASNRLTTPLFDTQTTTKILEKAYSKTWHLYLQKIKPSSFKIDNLAQHNTEQIRKVT